MKIELTTKELFALVHSSMGKNYEPNDLEFACYFDGELVEYERWTDRGWMYRTPKEPKTLYFTQKHAHSTKVLLPIRS